MKDFGDSDIIDLQDVTRQKKLRAAIADAVNLEYAARDAADQVAQNAAHERSQLMRDAGIETHDGLHTNEELIPGTSDSRDEKRLLHGLEKGQVMFLEYLTQTLDLLGSYRRSSVSTFAREVDNALSKIPPLQELASIEYPLALIDIFLSNAALQLTREAPPLPELVAIALRLAGADDPKKNVKVQEIWKKQIRAIS